MIAVFLETIFLSTLFIGVFPMSSQGDISVKLRPAKAILRNWYTSTLQTQGIL